MELVIDMILGGSVDRAPIKEAIHLPLNNVKTVLY